jgi:two-component SAPR family response regulator
MCIDWPRLQSLLAYLVVHHNAPQSRTHLASLLWPESQSTQAHSNLQTLLTREDDSLCKYPPSSLDFLTFFNYNLTS